jgi:hypothetical protein
MVLYACGENSPSSEGGSDGESGILSAGEGASASDTDATGSASASASATAADETGGGTGSTKFDLGGQPDADLSCGGNGKGGGGAADFSYIWVANSSQGTVSKINTETGLELGRYIVRADGAGSPSRTSVNRFGDVAVANRLGGVAKVYASELDCTDDNGVPGIQTSQNGGDILPWGEDECFAWFSDLPHGDNRPVAWTNGVFNDETCLWDDVDVWTAWSDWAPGSCKAPIRSRGGWSASTTMTSRTTRSRSPAKAATA